jgi:hypothetical protein
MDILTRLGNMGALAIQLGHAGAPDEPEAAPKRKMRGTVGGPYRG